MTFSTKRHGRRLTFTARKSHRLRKNWRGHSASSRQSRNEPSPRARCFRHLERNRHPTSDPTDPCSVVLGAGKGLKGCATRTGKAASASGSLACTPVIWQTCRFARMCLLVPKYLLRSVSTTSGPCRSSDSSISIACAAPGPSRSLWTAGSGSASHIQHRFAGVSAARSRCVGNRGVARRRLASGSSTC
jgi:hypothetical protein